MPYPNSVKNWARIGGKSKDVVNKQLAAQVTAVEDKIERHPELLEKLDNSIDTTGTAEEQRREILEKLIDVSTDMGNSYKQASFVGYLHWYFKPELIISFFSGLGFYYTTIQCDGFNPNTPIANQFYRVFFLGVVALGTTALHCINKRSFGDIRRSFLANTMDYQWGHAPQQLMGYRLIVIFWANAFSIGGYALAALAVKWLVTTVNSPYGADMPDTLYQDIFFEFVFVFILDYVYVQDYVRSHSAVAVLAAATVQNNESSFSTHLLDSNPNEYSPNMNGNEDNDISISRSMLGGKLYTEAIRYDNNPISLVADTTVRMIGYFLTQGLAFSYLNFNAVLGYCIVYKSSWTNVWVQLMAHLSVYIVMSCYSMYKYSKRHYIFLHVKRLLAKKGVYFKKLLPSIKVK